MLHVEESIPSFARVLATDVTQTGDVPSIDGDNWSFTYLLKNRFRRVRSSFGETEGMFFNEEDYYGYPPINVSNNYPYVDLLNRFYNTVHFLSDWKFEAPTPSFKGKKPLRHHSMRGDVAIKYGAPLYHTKAATWPEGDAISRLYPYRSYEPEDSIVLDLSQDLRLLDVVSQLSGELSTCYVMPWPEQQGYYEGSVVDYNLHYVANCVDLRVLVYYVSHWQGQINATWAAVHRFAWYLQWEVPIGGIHIPLDDILHAVYTEEVISSGLHFWAEQHPLSWYRNVLDPYLDSDAGEAHCESMTTQLTEVSSVALASVGSRLDAAFGLSSPYRHVGGTDRSFLHYTKVCDALLRDALPHAAIAAQDAFETGVASMGLNMYESLPEFLGVFALVDVVALAKDAMKLVRSRKVSVSTLSVMVDLLCDARLLYAYALRPSAQDLVSIATGAKALKRRWFSGGDFLKSPLAGVDEIPVPDDLCEPFSGMRLRSAVKVEGHFDPDSLLLKFLPLKAVGMLPELSLLWASLPFSFVVDNIINVSNGLEQIDMFLQTNAFYRTDVVTATHLFKWEPILAEVLQLHPTQDEVFRSDLEFRSFYREIYQNLPLVGPSRILAPYFSTHEPSDFLTYGALAYKVLKV